jgi:hypothetical protein
MYRSCFERITDELRTLPPVSAPTGRPKEARGNAPGNQHACILEPCKGGLIRAISLVSIDPIGVTR